MSSNNTRDAELIISAVDNAVDNVEFFLHTLDVCNISILIKAITMLSAGVWCVMEVFDFNYLPVMGVLFSEEL